MVRDTILILEDDELSRRRLEEILRNKYKIQAVMNERRGGDTEKAAGIDYRCAGEYRNTCQGWV